MPDPQDLIDSGTLELYALGALPPAEAAAVQAAAAAHPAVAQALAAAEAAAATYAAAHAHTPPAALRGRVLAAALGPEAAARLAAPAKPEKPTQGLEKAFDSPEKPTDKSEKPTGMPEKATRMPEMLTDRSEMLTDRSEMLTDRSEMLTDRSEKATDKPEKVTDRSEKATDRAETRPAGAWRGTARPRRRSWATVAAAALAALLLSLGANAWLYQRWHEADRSLLALQADQTRLAQAAAVAQRTVAAVRTQNQVLRSDAFRPVALAGTPAHPQARARVLYNAATHAVYFDARALPALPPNRQYQLWALDRGQPVDAGVLAAATAAGDSLQAMKNIARAQAFALTVEPVGGSAGPTLATMTVLGNI